MGQAALAQGASVLPKCPGQSSLQYACPRVYSLCLFVASQPDSQHRLTHCQLETSAKGKPRLNRFALRLVEPKPFGCAGCDAFLWIPPVLPLFDTLLVRVFRASDELSRLAKYFSLDPPCGARAERLLQSTCVALRVPG